MCLHHSSLRIACCNDNSYQTQNIFGRQDINHKIFKNALIFVKIVDISIEFEFEFDKFKKADI